VAATFVVIPVGGLVAHCVADDERGRAAEWYQAASLGGSSLGGESACGSRATPRYRSRA